jgi:hypothetical protein
MKGDEKLNIKNKKSNIKIKNQKCKTTFDI